MDANRIIRELQIIVITTKAIEDEQRSSAQNRGDRELMVLAERIGEIRKDIEGVVSRITRGLPTSLHGASGPVITSQHLSEVAIHGEAVPGSDDCGL